MVQQSYSTADNLYDGYDTVKGIGVYDLKEFLKT